MAARTSRINFLRGCKREFGVTIPVGARRAIQSVRDALANQDGLVPTLLHSRALDLQARRGHNKATVALANKLARIAWATWRHDRDFTSTL